MRVNKKITINLIKDNSKIPFSNFSSKSKIKEIKEAIQNVSDKKNNHLKLFYKGKELVEDNQEVESFCKESIVDLIMLNISLSEDAEANNIKIENAVVRKLSNFCEIHTEEKTLFLCLTCKNFICVKCESSYHQGHQLINKNEINNYEKKLQNLRNDLNSKLRNIGIDCNFQDFYKKFRSDFNKRGEEILELVESIKKREIVILNKFKSHLDKYFPKVMDYRDNLDSLINQISISNRENILKNETEFSDFYEKFLQFNEIIPKTEVNIEFLISKIEKYNEKFEKFKQKTEDILHFMTENLDKINEIQTTEEQYLEKTSNSQRKPILKAPQKRSDQQSINEINYISNNNNNKNNLVNESNEYVLKYATPQRSNFQNTSIVLPKELTTKMSIINTLNKAMPSNMKAVTSNSVIKLKDSQTNISDNSNQNLPKSNLVNGSKQGVVMTFSNKRQSIDDIEGSKNKGEFNNLIIIGESEQVVENQVINLIVATKNLLIFDFKTKSFTKVETDLSNLSFKKFETYHSTINYNNKFYVAGGYGYANSTKIFGVYNSELNNFTKLPDMPTGHSYNGLVGRNKNIFVISGFKSNKVEKYNFVNNDWTKLPDLNFCRSWPNCFFINNHELYVVGGYIEGQSESNIYPKIEYLDVLKNKSWEIKEINTGEQVSIPFNCGLLQINSEIVLVGGRIEKEKESEKSCRVLEMKSQKITVKEDIKLAFTEEFDGKNFVFLGDDKYGQFSSIYYNKFYVFNNKEKIFETSQFNEEG